MRRTALSPGIPTSSFRQASSPGHAWVMGLCYLPIFSTWAEGFGLNWLLKSSFGRVRAGKQLHKAKVSIHGWSLTEIWPMLYQARWLIYSLHLPGRTMRSSWMPLQAGWIVIFESMCNVIKFGFCLNRDSSLQKGKKWEPNPFLLNAF